MLRGCVTRLSSIDVMSDGGGGGGADGVGGSMVMMMSVADGILFSFFLSFIVCLFVFLVRHRVRSSGQLDNNLTHGPAALLECVSLSHLAHAVEHGTGVRMEYTAIETLGNIVQIRSVQVEIDAVDRPGEDSLPVERDTLAHVPVEHRLARDVELLVRLDSEAHLPVGLDPVGAPLKVVLCVRQYQDVVHQFLADCSQLLGNVAPMIHGVVCSLLLAPLFALRTRRRRNDATQFEHMLAQLRCNGTDTTGTVDDEH